MSFSGQYPPPVPPRRPVPSPSPPSLPLSSKPTAAHTRNPITTGTPTPPIIIDSDVSKSNPHRNQSNQINRSYHPALRTTASTPPHTGTPSRTSPPSRSAPTVSPHIFVQHNGARISGETSCNLIHPASASLARHACESSGHLCCGMRTGPPSGRIWPTV